MKSQLTKCVRRGLLAGGLLFACSSGQLALAQDLYETNNTIALASNIFAGVPQSHLFTNEYDIDWVTFTTTVNRAYQIGMTNLDAGSVFGSLALYNITTNLVASGDNMSGGGDIWLTSFLGTSGVYYAQAAADNVGSGTGPYWMVVNDLGAGDQYEPDNTLATASNFVVDVSQPRSLHWMGDADYAKFTNTANHLYLFEATNYTDAMSITLYDTDGTNALASDNSMFGDASFEYLPVSTGLYYVSVSLFGGGTSAYYLAIADRGLVAGDAYELDNSVATASNITVGVGQTNRSIHWSGDLDYVAVVVTSAHRYVIAATNVGTNLDVAVSLYGTNGTTLLGSVDSGANGGNEFLTNVCTITGTNFIKLASGGGTGAYSLVVTDIGTVPLDSNEVDNSIGQAALITPGIPQTNRTIHLTSEVDFLQFTAQGERYYAIETYNLDWGLDTYLYLYDATGTNLLASDNDSGYGPASWLEYKIQAAGTYYIKVSANSAASVGYYSIRVTDTRVREKAWKTRVSLGAMSSPAIGNDGLIYVGSYDSNMYAFAPGGTTSKVWHCGSYIASSPAIASNGSVYIGSHDDYFYCFNTNGTTNWISTTTFGDIVGSPALSFAGRVYIGSAGFRFLSFNPDGTTNWTKTLPGQARVSPAVGSDGTVYIGCDLTNFYSLNPNGTITNWVARLPTANRSSPAIDSNGQIYAACFSGNLYAFNPTNGATNHVWATGKFIDGSSPVIGTNGDIYIGAYQGTTTGMFYSFKPDGTTNWAIQFTNTISSTPLIGYDGTIYIGTEGGYFYAFNPDGTTNFMTALSYDVSSAPVIDTNGLLYVVAENRLFAIYSTSYGVGGLEESSWPMFLHDARHTGALAPPAPPGVTASDGSFTNQILITWNTTTNTVSYDIYRSTTNNSATAVRIGQVVSNQHDDTSPVPATAYYYWVKAINHSGNSPFGLSDSGWRMIAPPEGIAASDGTSTAMVQVAWNSVSGAVSYLVFRNTTNDAGSASNLTEIAETNYNDTTTVASITYYYWVQARGANGTNSAFSLSDSGWRMIAPPGGVTASDGASTAMVQVAWNSADGAVNYVVWRNITNDTGSASNLTEVAGTNYDDTAAITNITYYYWIQARGANGTNSAFSLPDSGWRAAPVGGVTNGTSPSVPAGLAASDGAYTDKVRLNWNAVTNADGYSLFRSTSSSTSDAVAIGSSTTTNYDDTSATGGQLFYYWVKATNALGASAFSASDSGWRRAIYTITATAGAHGSISPSGAVSVVQGASQMFTILPEAGYHIGGVIVDGAAAGAVATYTFNDVSANHTIAASFTANQPPVLALAVNPTDGMAPLRVQFDFTGSADPDGSVVKFEVDRTGDGIFEVQSTDTGNFIVEYSEAGAYQTIARITDNDNATAATSVVVTVRGVSPVADIAAYPESGNAPLTVTFQGTNSSAPMGRMLVAYEWDFNGDGVYDRLSRTGVITWTYRQAGTNLAALRVTDNKGVQATDTVVVRVDPPTTPPPVVSLTATPLAGYLPLEVAFTAAIADGRPVTNYYWDFDGDSHYDRRTSIGVVSNVYTIAGTYQARVLVIDASGLAGTNSVSIQVSEANTLRVWLSTPRDGNRVSGSSVSLIGHAAPASQLRSAQFQVKPAASNTWENLGAAIVPPPYAYSLAWDITGVALGDYDLRLSAVDTDGNTVVANAVRVTLVSGNGRQPGDVHEGTQDGQYQRTETFSADETATLRVFDGTMVIVLMETVGSNLTVVVALTGNNTNPVNGAAFGRVNINANRHVSIEGNPELQQPVVIIIPYDDDNNDGLIDGTQVRVDSLVMYWYDPTAGEWQRCLTTEVHPDEKYVRGTVYHLTEFGLFGSIKGLPIFGDFDGDRKTDPAVYEQASGNWRVLLSGSEYREVQLTLGGPDSAPVPADYDADQKADPGVYQESRGYWYGYLSSRAYSRLDSAYLGGTGYTFVPADYDGDGKADPGVYRESTGQWAAQLSGSDYAIVSGLFGGIGQMPVPADYDGDGKADPALYGETSGTWYFLLSGYEYTSASVVLGGSGYVAIPADYDGDAKADPAVYEQASGQWRILQSNNNYSPLNITLGGSGYLPVPGEYDGAGAVAPAVYQESSGTWRILLPSLDYNEVSTVFGGASFAPVIMCR